VNHKSPMFVTIVCNHPRGHVCKIWRECARKAFEDEWMRAAYIEFEKLSGTNLGFGCMAFQDMSFPGMPTFHRAHMEIFKEKVVPDIFINQDGDPFIFQLYRSFGCSKMFSSRISNEIGGEAKARYTKQSAKDWTFETLDVAS